MILEHYKCAVDIATPLLGFVGTILVYFYGVPRQIDTRGLVFRVTGEVDVEEKAKIKRYKIRGTFGLSLIALSFLLQLFQAWVF